LVVWCVGVGPVFCGGCCSGCFGCCSAVLVARCVFLLRCCSSGCVVLLCPVFCSWWCCGCWCVSPPVRCTVLVVVAPGSCVALLVVVGPPPLFCSWWCFCSCWWLILVVLLLRFLSKKPPFLGGCVVLLRAAIEVCLGVLSCSLRRLRIRRSCLVCVWFGFLLLLVFRLVLVSLVLCVLSVLPRLFRGFVSSLARFSCFVLFSSLRLVVWRVLLCVCFFRSVSLLLLVMI